MLASKVTNETKAATASTSNLVQRSRRLVNRSRSIGVGVPPVHDRTVGNQSTLSKSANHSPESTAKPERYESEANLVGQRGLSPSLDFTRRPVSCPEPIRPADDPLEHKADRVADQVMGMRDPEHTDDRPDYQPGSYWSIHDRALGGDTGTSQGDTKVNGGDRQPQLSSSSARDLADSPGGRDVQPSGPTSSQRLGKVSESRTIPIQTKLALNTPGDPYEQEADRISEHVTRMPDSELHRKCAYGGTCADCQSGHSGQHQRFQPKGRDAGDAPKTAVPPLVDKVLQSPGERLDPATLRFMEPRFGYDFGAVRVHADATAAESARAVHAHAYTQGEHIVFARGRYEPTTAEGRRLVGHELAHVVQQVGQSSGLVQRQNDDDNGSDGRSSKDRSRQTRPRNPPPGTVPIDQTGLDRETIHKIKDGIGAGPQDWVGVAPDGHVITSDPDGNAVDNGHVSDFSSNGVETIPKWVWGLIGIAAAIGIIVLFATGVGEVGLILAGASAVVILAVKAALRAVGRDSSATASTADGSEETDQGSATASTTDGSEEIDQTSVAAA